MFISMDASSCPPQIQGRRRPTRWSSMLTAIVTLTFAVVVLNPAPAGAQEACDLTDDFGGLNDVNGLRAAIQSAEEATGVDFAVYATDALSSTSGNLDSRLAEEVRDACSQIFESPNNVADNTVLLAVSVGDRHTVIAFGDDLDERLDDDADDIVAQMNDFFRNGEIGAGLASGVGSTVTGLDTTPADFTTPVVGGVLGTAAVVGGGAWLYTKRRTRVSRGEVASKTFAEADSRVTNIQARWFDSEQEAVIVGGRVTGNAMTRMNEAQTRAAELSRKLYEAWSPVSEVTADDVARMSVDDQQEVNGHAAEAMTAAGDAEKALDDLEEVIENLRGRPDALAAMHTEAIERVRSGLDAADAREAEGWEVDAGRQRLAALSAELGHLDPHAIRIDPDLLGEALEPMAAEVAEVAGDLESLAQRHTETIERRDEMGVEIEGQRGRVMMLRSAMNGWSAEHATASFQNVLKHPDEADGQLSIAASSHGAAQSIGEIGRDLGVMQTVNGELDRAENALDLADELLDEMDELDVLLAAAKQGASAAVAASADDAVVLVSYVEENRRDVPSRAPQVASEVLKLQRLAEESLRVSPPDYLRAMELAGQVESIVETELQEFATTVAERQRKRNSAQSELRSAHVAVDRADRHVQSHVFSSRLDRSAQGSIDKLRAELGQAQSLLESNPDDASSRAQVVEQKADQIYREAQRRQRHNGRGGFGGGFGGGIIIGGGGFRGHGGGRRHRGGGWGGGGGGGFGGGFGGGSSGGWGGGGGGFGGGSSGGW